MTAYWDTAVQFAADDEIPCKNFLKHGVQGCKSPLTILLIPSGVPSIAQANGWAGNMVRRTASLSLVVKDIYLNKYILFLIENLCFVKRVYEVLLRVGAST
jgi:hypothetical protein